MVICVVAPPDAHPGCGVASEVLPGAPERVEPGHSFRVHPPLGVPAEFSLGADLAAVGDDQKLSYEFVGRAVERLRPLEGSTRTSPRPRRG